MFNLICLTKTYNLNDMQAWLAYHSIFVDKIYLLDNDSIVDIKQVAKQYSNVEYMQIHGFADQWNLFSDILNQKTDIKFNEEDFVCFLDDDEYLYYDLKQNFNEVVNNQFKSMLDCIMLPEILMSTIKYQKKRDKVLPEFSTYRRPDLSSQGKAIICWKSYSKYSYTLHNTEKGHIPWINGLRYSDVVGSGVSKTTYGLTQHDIENQPIALIHYHIKSEDDWNMKIKRGSAANPSTESRQNGSYEDDIHKNIKFDGYKILDLTMKNTYQRVINSTV